MIPTKRVLVPLPVGVTFVADLTIATDDARERLDLPTAYLDLRRDPTAPAALSLATDRDATAGGSALVATARAFDRLVLRLTLGAADLATFAAPARYVGDVLLVWPGAPARVEQPFHLRVATRPVSTRPDVLTGG